MSRGTWEGNTPQSNKVRPGLYNRFTSLATARIDATQKGVAGIMIKADWGPLEEVVMVENETEIKQIFGTGQTVNLAIRMMKGGKKYKPRKVLIYRMATAEAEVATATITTSMKFSAKYAGLRGNNFKIVVAESATEEEKMNVSVYEGSNILKKYTVAANDLIGLEKAINEDSESLIIAEKIGDTALTEQSSVPFTGGKSGEAVTSEGYLKALAAFEAAYVNTLALDGVTDEDILTLFKNWQKRVWDSGNLIQIVIGGTAENDKDPKVGNSRSKNCDSYSIINAIVGAIDSLGKKYSSAEMAPQIAGAIAALPLNQSITYKELEDIVDVTVALSNTQIEEALNAGSFVLIRDIDPEDFSVTVKVESGINTFTSFTEKAGNKLRKIKAISTMAAIDYDTGKYAMKNVIGELDNNDDGRAALIAGISQYLEVLAEDNVISSDMLVGLSETLTSEDDYVFLETQALSIDKIERIFNNINL